MSFKIFISYSLSPKEYAALYAVCEEAAKRGITHFVPDRKWDPKNDLPERIKANLKEADAVVVIASNYGIHYDWLNKELKTALEMKKEKIIILADREVDIDKSYQSHIVHIDRNNFAKTVANISQKLEKMKLAKKQNEALTWLTVGGVLFLLFLVLTSSLPLQDYERVDKLMEIYCFKDEYEKFDVLIFIQNNKFLIPVLEEAYKKIKVFFGNTQNFLTILEEPEDEDFRELFIVIKTDKELKVAMKLLDDLFDDWFVDVLPQTAGLLDITFERKDEF